MMEIYADTIRKVCDFLTKCGVPYTLHFLWDGFQLRFNWTRGDVAVHRGTLGARYGSVETYNFPWDCGDVSQVDPQAAAELIVDYYDRIKGE